MRKYHLAEINIASPLHDRAAPEFAGFLNAIEAVNAFAEASPGFVWRLKEDNESGATGLDPYGDGTLINISVWNSLESLKQFTYQTGHAAYLRRWKEWFRKLDRPHLALWWVPEGHEPDVEEAMERLEIFRQLGPGPDAFSFSRPFAAPEG